MSEIISEFKRNYAAALTKAEKAAETTETSAWRELYTDLRDRNATLRGLAADRIEAAIASLRQKPLNADAVKDLKEAARNAQDISEAALTFELQTVKPLQSTVQRCLEIIGSAEAEAASAARAMPLTDADTPELLAEVIAQQPKVSWNPAIGAVVITNSKAVK